jgi:hypothetical protein
LTFTLIRLPYSQACQLPYINKQNPPSGGFLLSIYEITKKQESIMIINEYSLGMIAKYGLLQDIAKTKTDNRLNIEYLKENGQHFTTYFINNEIKDGFRFGYFEGKTFYELSIIRMSIPHHARTHLNVEFSLITIPESQEFSEVRITANVALNLPRLTDKTLFSLIQIEFNENKSNIIELHRNHRIPSHSDRFKFGNGMGAFTFFAQGSPEYRTCF